MIADILFFAFDVVILVGLEFASQCIQMYIATGFGPRHLRLFAPIIFLLFFPLRIEEEEISFYDCCK